MNTSNIRLATITDLDNTATLFDAYRQFYKQESNIQLAKAFISARIKYNESIIFIAEDQKKNAVGFCQVYPTFCSILAAQVYLLSDLFVVPGQRKSGIGKQLLEQAHAHAKEHNIPRMDLTTAKTNLNAQSLYESLGWIKDDVYFAYNKTV